MHVGAACILVKIDTHLLDVLARCQAFIKDHICIRKVDTDELLDAILILHRLTPPVWPINNDGPYSQLLGLQEASHFMHLGVVQDQIGQPV